MTKRQYRQYEMLVRVRKFGDEHKEHFPEGSEGGKSFATIAQGLAQIDAFTNDKLNARRLTTREKTAARLSLFTHINTIARSARILAKTVPGANDKFRLPPQRSAIAVLQSGRVFLEEAEPLKDTFIKCGLRPSFVEELQIAIARLEQAIAGRSEANTAAVVAQKGVRDAITTAVDAVMSLDVLVANVLGHDRDVRNAWKDLRHVDPFGKNPTFDAPPDNGVSTPASTEEHPIPSLEEPPALKRAS